MEIQKNWTIFVQSNGEMFVETFSHDQEMKTGGLDVEFTILEKDFSTEWDPDFGGRVYYTCDDDEEDSGTIITKFMPVGRLMARRMHNC